MINTLEARLEKDLDQCSDEEVFIFFRDTGDQQAFEIIEKRFKPRLRAFFVTRLNGKRNLQKIDDLVQETLLGVFRSARTFKGNRKFASWIFSIATYKQVDEHRYSSRRGGHNVSLGDLVPEDSQKYLADGSATPIDFLIEQETIALREQFLANSIEMLPGDQRDAIKLLHYEGYRNKDAAKLRDMTEQQFAGLSFRAREELKQMAIPFLEKESGQEAA